MFEYSDECEKSSSLGFIELLNMQDFGPSVFDLLQTPFDLQNSTVQLRESSEVLNAPATPNYSSISSESSEHANKEPEEREDDDDDEREVKVEENHKTKKELKVKKTNQKEREARFAFMTKSEVDHLEDGYRWRKYGQKAVKNSPFPRSYYRCTNASCNVKKRVERSCNDPTIVVTTYEGQHTHASPQMPRPAPPPLYLGFSAAAAPPPQRHNLINYSVLLNGAQQMSFGCPNNGLLQDMVPNWSTIKKEGH
ncbi:hypothetical protein ACS0TY_005174 [Phlomoides rotata]